jgi:hypothetical protein
MKKNENNKNNFIKLKNIVNLDVYNKIRNEKMIILLLFYLFQLKLY